MDGIDPIKTKVQQYLSRWFHGQQVTEDENIFDRGLVNSLFVMQMILFLEKEFGVEIHPQELEPNALSSVARIARLVRAQMDAEAV